MATTQPGTAAASASSLVDYLPIAEHGIIGDLHSIALVGTDARIDWYCCPRFDSPSVFGAILDRERGGFYRIAPVGAYVISFRVRAERWMVSRQRPW